MSSIKEIRLFLQKVSQHPSVTDLISLVNGTDAEKTKLKRELNELLSMELISKLSDSMSLEDKALINQINHSNLNSEEHYVKFSKILTKYDIRLILEDFLQYDLPKRIEKLKTKLIKNKYAK